MSDKKVIDRRNHLLLGTALVGAFLSSYGRRVYAGACTGSGGTYTCSGPASGTDTTQSLTGTTLTVTTTPGFGLTAPADAIVITGTNGASFDDENDSPITGIAHGISVSNAAGPTSVTTTGTVTGVNNDGIAVFSFGAGQSINAGAVNGGTDGIFAENSGTGTLSVTATGPVTGARYGLAAQNTNGASTDLTIASSAVTGATGIHGRNTGSGILSITATGVVTGTSGAGIYAAGYGENLTINAAQVGGRTNGIYGIIRIGSTAGNLEVTTTDAVIAGTGEGVHVKNYSGGSVSVTAGAPVSSAGSDGISAYNSNNTGTDMTISSASVSGLRNGITATNRGTGALSITATGTLTASIDDGLHAYNSGTDLSIAAADVSGGANGIYAFNQGTGALSITTTGTATGTSGAGIYARAGVDGSGLIINAVNASGGAADVGRTDGILAFNYGHGDLSIFTSGSVTGNGRDGIIAANFGTDLRINATDVRGESSGVAADNLGAGALFIATTGTVTGIDDDGVNAKNYGTDLTIASNMAGGARDGIYALNYGSGGLKITATGATAGAGRYGIYALNNAGGSGLTISAADVSGGVEGINANNRGTGSLSITATGTVTGMLTEGIYAINQAAGTDLTIDVAGVRGGRHGIYAINHGSGALSISATGTVAGTATYGIFAVNYNGTDLAIHAADVSGGVDGIDAFNNGRNLMVTAANVGGGTTGIRASNYGSGAVAITASGLVRGVAADGLYAYNSSRGTGLSIQAADVSGGRNGIYARNDGSGALSITTTGAVRGDAHAGIDSDNEFGTHTAITVESTSSVAGPIAAIETASANGQPIGIRNAGTIRNLSGAPASLAISTSGGPTTIDNSGTVLGTVNLGYRDDTFNNRVGAIWNSAGGTNDFGGGTNAVNNEGLVVAASDSTVTETTTFLNLTTFLNKAGGALSLRDGGAGDRAVVTGNFIGSGGAIALDTFLGDDSSSSDRLVIDGGSATGHSLVTITNVGGPGAETTGNGILIVQSTNSGRTAPGAFVLGKMVAAGPYAYLLFRGGVTGGADNNWFLRSDIDCSAPGAPAALCPPPPISPPSPPVSPPTSPPSPPALGSPPPPSPPVTIEPPHTELPLYRPAAALYAKAPIVARQVILTALGTFHTRQGDQLLVQEDGAPPVASATSKPSTDYFSNVWIRTFGEHLVQEWEGPANPEFKGNIAGFQAGMDVADIRGTGDQSDHLGLFYAYASAQGTGEGFILGIQHNLGGNLDFTADNIGGYWTHIGAGGWYSDLVAMGSFVSTSALSLADSFITMKSRGVTLSGEAGAPFRLSRHWLIEPEAQLVWQHATVDPTADNFSTLDFHLDDGEAARVGIRLEGHWRTGTGVLQPNLYLNYLYVPNGLDTTLFNSRTTIGTPFGARAIEGGAGLTATIGPRFGVYARGGYTANLGGPDRETIAATIGAHLTL